jgi:peptide/nickel transport system substrate-binding protein
LNSFTNATVTESIDYSKLITIFYNTQDKDLSDKKLREALSYSIPDSFSHGKRNYGPFVPNSWVGQDGLASYSQDLEHSKLLLGQIQGSSKSASLTLEIKTLAQFVPLASQIKSIWEHLGIKTNVNIVSTYPSDFQVFLGEFNVPKDPDQYTLWHSSQMNNITNYKNLRIDKLLEDGRQTLDLSEREKIYSDFQKYLLDDPPATFLYFPFVYEVTRK